MGVVFFLLTPKRTLYIKSVGPLIVVWVVNVFPISPVDLLTLLLVVFLALHVFFM